MLARVQAPQGRHLAHATVRGSISVAKDARPQCPSQRRIPNRADQEFLGEQTLRCSASEGISLLPVMAAFREPLAGHVNPEDAAHAACFLLLAIVVGQSFRSTRGLMDPNVSIVIWCFASHAEIALHVPSAALSSSDVFREPPLGAPCVAQKSHTSSAHIVLRIRYSAGFVLNI